MPAPEQFTTAFEKYIRAARDARAQDDSEHQRKEIFLSFITAAFGVEAHDIKREKHVSLNVKKRGFLDALFGDLIFEFKRRLDDQPDKWRAQLEDYLKADRDDYVGILTDGLKFEVYTLIDGHLSAPRPFDLEKEADDPEAVFIRFDALLFSQKNVAPTSADVVARFGGDSPTFQSALRELAVLLKRVDHLPVLAVWRGQWSKLLSKVYGSEVGDDDLFVRHTYLCQFARLLAYAALRGIPPDAQTVHNIINGTAFYSQGVSNIAEHDFFSWVLLNEIRDEALTLFKRLANSLIVYDLSRIDQDLLKQLYQNLVDPATRHELGEFYTPDWLAELTLQDIDYQHPQSLLDPACGSGSFLFAAVKRLAAKGLTGWELVRFAVDNVMGMDVHPLAVTIARINYLLALAEHLSGKPGDELLSIPVYMADALSAPELEQKYKETLVVPVDSERNENFFIPVSAAAAPDALTSVIEQMHQFAQRAGDPLKLEAFKTPFGNLVAQRLSQTVTTGVVGDMSSVYWQRNLTLLAKLIQEGRNGIWAYILKNQSRPLVLAERKFDVLAGNPPWLSYRFIRSKTYQKEVKTLYKYYKLIESNDTKQFSNMDLSTLFFAHAVKRYLRPGGTVAFVMPRSVITGAKQHRPFQAGGYLTRAIDLLGVFPLFNVPSCVLIREGTALPPRVAAGEASSIPAMHYSGTLRAHEINLADALPSLTRRETTVRFVDSDVRSPYYYERFSKGGGLFPRNLCFVKPEGIPGSPAVITDPEANREAKVPWKGISLSGVVEDDYIYATLLSKHLLPFGYEKLHMVALPARLDGDGRLKMLTNEMDFAERGHFRSYDWFYKAASKWDSLKKDSSTMTLTDRFDYQKLLSKQRPQGKIKVIYNETGTHISSCVVDTMGDTPSIYGRKTQGFVVDTKTYSYDAENLEEAHYLCALLNAESVDKAIKAYQTRGIFKGERDIHRTPFEANAIPPFDAKNADHTELARLSREAHDVIAAMKASGGLSGSVYRIREQARAAAAAQLAAIDVIARRVVGAE